YGLAITRAELIGLVPQAALIDSARWYLQLDGLEEDEILEMRLAQVEAEESAGIAGMLPYELLEATAAGTPTPGGGAIAAVAGALGAALAGMVAGLTVGRKKYAAVAGEAQQVQLEAARLRDELAEAAVADAASFEALLAVFRDETLDEEARKAAV